MSTPEIISVQKFTSKLLVRQHALETSFNDQSLVLGDSLLIYAMVYQHLPSLNLQVVITGPTQSGKSTLVNLLLGGEFAEASPLAGYTRHAQGFSKSPLELSDKAELDSLLPWLKRVERQELGEDRLDEFSLEPIQSPISQDNITIWDTPDFDSVSSRGYRSTVPQLCGIADAIIMVVSREKYADQSVWSLLELLYPSGKPITLVLNKVSDANQDALLTAVREKLTENNMLNIRVVTLPYLTSNRGDNLLSLPQAVEVQEKLLQWANERSHSIDRPQLKSFLTQHWSQWTEGVREEIGSQQQWQDEVERLMTQVREDYDLEYLQQTDHSIALQKAIVRLLELLEIPAVAGTLGRLRKIVTWPARQLGSFIKKQPEDHDETPDLEQQTLSSQLELTLLRLVETAADNSTHSSNQTQQWWQSLHDELGNQRSTLDTSVTDMIVQHQEAFEPKIEEAAQSLHRHLQEHPATLNGLRAARVSTDAAAVVVAIKSGGLGLSDLVFAPAMLAFTSMLTEGALGQYMAKTEAELKSAQSESAEKYIFQPLQQTLLDMPAALSQTQLIGISREELDDAEKALEAMA